VHICSKADNSLEDLHYSLQMETLRKSCEWIIVIDHL
jgi:hypothetical protein